MKQYPLEAEYWGDPAGNVRRMRGLEPDGHFEFAGQHGRTCRGQLCESAESYRLRRK
jgi:hypothetical protein